LYVNSIKCIVQSLSLALRCLTYFFFGESGAHHRVGPRTRSVTSSAVTSIYLVLCFGVVDSPPVPVQAFICIAFLESTPLDPDFFTHFMHLLVDNNAFAKVASLSLPHTNIPGTLIANFSF